MAPMERYGTYGNVWHLWKCMAPMETSFPTQSVLAVTLNKVEAGCIEENLRSTTLEQAFRADYRKLKATPGFKNVPRSPGLLEAPSFEVSLAANAPPHPIHPDTGPPPLLSADFPDCFQSRCSVLCVSL